MNKKIIIAVAALILIMSVFWIKSYYNDRYAVSDYYYTQIPKDEVNQDSWLLDANGVKQEKGKEYNLIGYNKNGEAKAVSFKKSGNAEDYYTPSTYIKISASKEITINVEVIDKTDIPEQALSQIEALGTRQQ